MALLLVLAVALLLAALAASPAVRETVQAGAASVWDMIRLKDASVSVDGLMPELWRAVSVAGAFWRERGDTLTITSGLDGTHSATSFHPKGLAVDLRTSHLTPAEILDRAGELLVRLGGGYDVIIEATHLHVEYDGRIHTAVTFWPATLAASFA